MALGKANKSGGGRPFFPTLPGAHGCVGSYLNEGKTDQSEKKKKKTTGGGGNGEEKRTRGASGGHQGRVPQNGKFNIWA